MDNSAILILMGTVRAKQGCRRKVEEILSKSFVEFEQDGMRFNILSYTTTEEDKNDMSSYLKKVRAELKDYSSGAISIFKQDQHIKWGTKL